MENSTNQESVIDVEENHKTNSIIALWKFVAPKIDVARNILFSAIIDLLDKSKLEENESRRESSNSMHWKNTKKSIWTLSTTTGRQASLPNIHLDPSVFKVLDDLSLATDETGRSLHNFDLKCQSAENLDDEVHFKRNNAVYLRLSKEEKSSYIAKFFLHEKKNRSEVSSMSSFSEDSIVSKKSYHSVRRKKNLVIKCDYSTIPSPKNILQVYGHHSSQLPPTRRSSSSSDEQFFDGNNRRSNERKWVSRNSEPSFEKPKTSKRIRSNNHSEKGNSGVFRRRRTSKQSKSSVTSSNRPRCNEEIREGRSQSKPSSRFSKILSKLWGGSLRLSSHANGGEQNNYILSKPLLNQRSCDSPIASAHDIQSSMESHTSKRHGLPYITSFDFPPYVPVSFKDETGAPAHFVPHLTVRKSKHRAKKRHNFRQSNKSTQYMPPTRSNFKLSSKHGRSGQFINSFCGLKARIIASASSPRREIPDAHTLPFTSRTSIPLSYTSEQYELQRGGSQNDFKLKYGTGKSRPLFPSMFSRTPQNYPKIGYDVPTRSKMQPDVCYIPPRPSRVVMSESKPSERKMFGVRNRPLVEEESESSNSDDSDRKISMTLLSNGDIFPTKRKKNRFRLMPKHKYSSSSLRYSVGPARRYYSDDSPLKRHYGRKTVYQPYDSSTDDDRKYFYPYPLVEYPGNTDEYMYYCPSYILPYQPAPLSSAEVAPMFDVTSSCMPRNHPPRPVPCSPPRRPFNPLHLAPGHQPSHHYSTHPSSHPYYSWIGSYPYLVNSYIPCSTRTSTSSASSSHSQPGVHNRRAPYYKPGVPRAQSLLRLHENLISARGHKTRFERKRQVGRDKREGFAKFVKSRSFSTPSYPMRSYGPETFMDITPRYKRSRYSGYPCTKRPTISICPADCIPQVPGHSSGTSHPFYRYQTQKRYQTNDIHRSCHRREISKKTSCNSLISNQQLPKTKSRKVGNTSSSTCSLKNSYSSKCRSGSSIRSSSDGNVSRDCTTCCVSKYNSLEDTQNYPHRSSCTSSRTPSDYKNDECRNKRPSSLESMSCKRHIFGAGTCDTSFHDCDPVLAPTVRYRNMIGLRSQVCSSATDVHWKLKVKYGKIKHFDDRIRFELQKIGINQLIEASKPAKCCKQTILNQPSNDSLPYAASLASLPLDETDIKIIKQSVKMASKKKYCNKKSLENRKKLMYYANILTDDYNMKKPSVEPKYEIRFIYYKLDDVKRVQTLMNKKYNKKNKCNLLQIFNYFVERSMYHNTTKLLPPNPTNLINYFGNQTLINYISREKLLYSSRGVVAAYKGSIQFRLLGKYLILKRLIFSDESETSIFNYTQYSTIPLNLGKRHNENICTDFELADYQEHFSEWKKNLELYISAQTGLEIVHPLTNVEIFDRFFSKKRTLFLVRISNIYLFIDGFTLNDKSQQTMKHSLNSDEMNFKRKDIHILNLYIEPAMKISVIAEYHTIVLYFVDTLISRVCTKIINQHTDYPEQIILSIPSVQLQAKIRSCGMSSILEISLYIPDTINSVMNFVVNIDKMKDNRSFVTNRVKCKRNMKSICQGTKLYNKTYTDWHSLNEEIIAYIKLFNQRQVIDSFCITYITNLYLKFRKDFIMKLWNDSYEKNFDISIHDIGKSSNSEWEIILNANSNKIISQTLSFMESGTQKVISTLKLIHIIKKEDFILKFYCYRGNITKTVYNFQKKFSLDMNASDMQRIQHLPARQNFEYYGEIYNIDVFNFQVFPIGGNRLLDIFTSNKNVLFQNLFHDSKKYFIQLICSHRNRNMTNIYCAAVESMTKECRLSRIMESDVNLNNFMNLAPNFSEKCELFQTNLFNPIPDSKITVLSRINTENKLRIKNTNISKYTLHSSGIPYTQLDHENTKSFKYKFRATGTIHQFKMSPFCLPISVAEFLNRFSESAENIQINYRIVKLYTNVERINLKYPYNQYTSDKMKKNNQKKVSIENRESNISHSIILCPLSYNKSVSEEYQIDSYNESKPSTGKLEIKEDQTCNYGKQTSKRCQQKLPSKETKVTTILPCCGTSGSIIQRSGDSLESLLDDCLENGKLMKQGDNHRHERRNMINYQMVEDTLMECLNLTGNPNSLQGMSHTILRYFTYTVFNQIKKNYYKHVSRKQRRENCNNRQDFTILYFNSKNSHAFSLENVDVDPEEKASIPKPKEERSKDDLIPTQGLGENTKSIPNSTVSVPGIEAKISSKDAFLCNLPNAPPFILKMNKTSFGTDVMSEKEDKTPKNNCNESPSLQTSTIDSLEVGRVSHISSTLCRNKCSGYSEVSKHNLFIDNTCPAISNLEFRQFLGKSISIIKNNKDIFSNKSRGCFMSSPTICMTGLSGFSINPFTMDERDSKRPGQNITCRPSTDILSNQTQHYHSKIPRMLHPGKYKVHTKMRNVQLSPGTKGYTGKSQACSSKACNDHCSAERMENQMNTNMKTGSTTGPSGTNTCAAANARSEKRQSVIKNITPQTPDSQAPMGDCVKGIKSDPGCYCGSLQNEPIPCPVRLKETFEYDDEDTTKEEDEDNEDMCYCPPGEQPLLMKKSNIECDCANRNRCENETLVDPPVEKPNVFWALTKVSLLKDGTKNFEIIDVSPLPPGYYLMPEVNNLILVGPQPKPVKATPNKNCSCK